MIKKIVQFYKYTIFWVKKSTNMQFNEKNINKT
ncbi:hypothetical protein P23_2566 [Acinetobacter calcoaceticus]|nr:hypothetical protein P23_2566 [Acinetobacter calcoaceticus]